MEIGSYRELLPPEACDKLEEIQETLGYLLPQEKSFLLFWLREKTRRGKVPGDDRERPLYKGAELAEEVVKAIQGETFLEFDESYLEYLYRDSREAGFSDKAVGKVSSYLSMTRTLSELAFLFEHLTDDEITNTMVKMLREEPKEEWYARLSEDCEDSVAIRGYYAQCFGVPEQDVFCASDIDGLKKQDVVYMVLADGAEPEPAMFIKNVMESRTGERVSVFCHEDQAADSGLEYFTVSAADAPFIPMARKTEDAGVLEKISLWAARLTDFSDREYLGKPTAEQVAARYAQNGLAKEKRFRNGVLQELASNRAKKEWTFGKGKAGEVYAVMPAYVKAHAYRLRAIQFENSGTFSIPYSKLLELAGDMKKEQDRLVESVFAAMQQFAELEREQASRQEADRQRQQENVMQKGAARDTRVSPER